MEGVHPHGKETKGGENTIPVGGGRGGGVTHSLDRATDRQGQHTWRAAAER